MRVAHPASFFTALPLSTAGGGLSIFMRGVEGCGPEAKGGGGRGVELQEYLPGVGVDHLHCALATSMNYLGSLPF